MSKFKGAAVAALTFAMLAFANPAAVAGSGRSIRVDLGSSNFSFNGQAWDGDLVPDLRGDGAGNGSIPFLLNFGAGAQQYDFSLSENGFVSLVAPGSGLGGGTLPPTGNYIAPFAADWVERYDLFDPGIPTDMTNVIHYGLGHIDTAVKGSYDYDFKLAPRALRFTWQGMCPAAEPDCFGGPSFQAVLIDRGGGDFDLELNGNSLATAGAAGGFVLGANKLTSIGPATTDFCFRGGRALACDDAVGVVPESGTLSLFAAGLLGLAGLAHFRRGSRRSVRVD